MLAESGVTITDSRLLSDFFPENDQSAVNRDPDLVFELVWAFLLAWGCGYCSQAGPVNSWELPLRVPHSASVVL